MTDLLKLIDDCIGEPYDLEGINGFNCFTFVDYLCRAHHGVGLGGNINVADSTLTLAKINDYKKRLKRIELPTDGCIVLMHKGRHVGMYIAGLVAHAHRRWGVVVQPLYRLKGELEFYEVATNDIC